MTALGIDPVMFLQFPPEQEAAILGMLHPQLGGDLPLGPPIAKARTKSRFPLLGHRI
jgi:hypothetical protein